MQLTVRGHSQPRRTASAPAANRLDTSSRCSRRAICLRTCRSEMPSRRAIASSVLPVANRSSKFRSAGVGLAGIARMQPAQTASNRHSSPCTNTGSSTTMATPRLALPCSAATATASSTMIIRHGNGWGLHRTVTRPYSPADPLSTTSRVATARDRARLAAGSKCAPVLGWSARILCRAEPDSSSIRPRIPLGSSITSMPPAGARSTGSRNDAGSHSRTGSPVGHRAGLGDDQPLGNWPGYRSAATRHHLPRDRAPPLAGPATMPTSVLLPDVSTSCNEIFGRFAIVTETSPNCFCG